MSKRIIIGQAGGKPIGFDLDTLIVSRLLIQANSGAGKSYALRKLTEELFGHVQVIVIDLEGEFATLREKFDFVLVGQGGETPAHPSTAGELAEKLLELKASAVCDLYELKAADRHLWVKNFLEALINAPKKLWHPVIVIVDEAHTFCPEKGYSIAKEAMTDLTTRGRKRGFCAAFATQRLAKLDKDTAAELLNVLVGGTFMDVDVERAAKDLGIPDREKRQFAAHMKTIEPGTFIALGRAISKERVELQIGAVQTTHPKPGSAKHAAAPPPAPDRIRELLPKLADLPKVAEERARTVAELEKQLREVREQLRQAQQQKPAPAIAVTSRREMSRTVDAAIEAVVRPLTQQIRDRDAAVDPVFREMLKAGEELEKFTAGFNRMCNTAGAKLGGWASISLKDVRKEVVTHITIPEAARRPAAVEVSAVNPRPVIEITRRFAKPNTYSAPAPETNGTDKLRDGAIRILAAAAQFYPQWIPKERIASLASLRMGGTFSTYQSSLASRGLIAVRGNRGGMELQATESGLHFISSTGNLARAPQSTDEVLSLWEPKLRDGARRMLRALVNRRGDEIPRQELAEAAGMQLGGTFSTYLSSLKTAGLAIETGAGIAANKETLFL